MWLITIKKNFATSAIDIYECLVHSCRYKSRI